MSKLTIQNNVPLAKHTTIGIGGEADYFTEVVSAEELRDALSFAREKILPVLVLGGGSNMLVSDNGWRGLVVRMAIMGIARESIGPDKDRLVSGGGENWDKFVENSVQSGLLGIECLSGIPGTVGASPIQNIGAYGQEVKDTIAWVEVLDRATGQLKVFHNADCGFAYRWSRFKGEDRDKYIVTRVAFDLENTGKPSLRYGDLTRYFELNRIANPTLSEVREAVLSVRRSKGMVVDPDIADSRSCGSFFMNPIVEEAAADRVKEIAISLGLMKADETMPRFSASDGYAKLSAAWLMERAGLRKGERLGNVGLSSRHVLALINCGSGTSTEVEAMIRRVQKTVHEKFGIALHPEPVFVGFDQQSSQPVNEVRD